MERLLDDINPPGNKVTKIMLKPDEFGTVYAKVEINGVVKTMPSSMFSNKYSPDEVIKMIEEAYMKKIKVKGAARSYRAKISNGMTIEMILEGDGTKIADIITVYPVHQLMLK